MMSGVEFLMVFRTVQWLQLVSVSFLTCLLSDQKAVTSKKEKKKEKEGVSGEGGKGQLEWIRKRAQNSCRRS